MIDKIGIDNIRLSIGFISEGILNTNKLDPIAYIGRDNPKKIPTISITLPRLLYNNNEKNLGREEYLKAVNEAKKDLAKLGIDLEDEHISYIEFNCNSNDISLYNTLELIERATIKDSVKVMETKTIDGIQSLKIQKSTYGIKIYKKSEMLRETGQGYPKEELLRFEVTTSHTEVLARLIPNRTFADIYDNWDKIIQWYKSCIVKGLQSPIERYIKATTNKLVKELEQGKKPSKVITGALMENDLVDTSIIDLAIKQYYKKAKKQKPQTLIKNIHKRLKEANEGRYNQMTGNIDKLNKLYKEIGI